MFLTGGILVTIGEAGRAAADEMLRATAVLMIARPVFYE